MNHRDYLLASYLLLDAALSAIAYEDDEGNECLDALYLLEVAE